MSVLRNWLAIGCVATMVACGPKTSASDAGHPSGTRTGSPDSGPGEPLDASYSTHSITSGSPTCVCPGQTAGEMSSPSTSSPLVSWTAQFDSTTLSAGDQLVLEFDFIGTTDWQIGLTDMPGHVAFPAIGGAPVSTGAWNCIYVVFSIGQGDYQIFVNDVSSPTISSPLATAVSGVAIQFMGSADSQAWVDSIEVTHIAMDGTSTTLYSQSFDNPDAVQAGLSAGIGYVASPPSSDALPGNGICPG